MLYNVTSEHKRTESAVSGQRQAYLLPSLYDATVSSGPYLLHKAPPFFYIPSSSPSNSHSQDLQCIPLDKVAPSCSWFTYWTWIAQFPIKNLFLVSFLLLFLRCDPPILVFSVSCLPEFLILVNTTHFAIPSRSPASFLFYWAIYEYYYDFFFCQKHVYRLWCDSEWIPSSAATFLIYSTHMSYRRYSTVTSVELRNWAEWYLWWTSTDFRQDFTSVQRISALCS
jgi:hypothetical protein